MRFSGRLASAALFCALALPLQAQETPADGDAEPVFGDPMEEAQEVFTREMTQAFDLFADIFKADPLTAEEEARLPLAREMVDHTFPEGTFAVVMQESMKPMMSAIMGAAIPDERAQLSAVTGLYEEDMEGLGDAEIAEALAVFDPHSQARNDAIGAMTVKLVGDMLSAMEPAYRTGLGRAYATRFSEDEMRELLAFFSTETGGKFAGQSIAVLYDPQMMAMMQEMGPAMAGIFPSMLEEVAAIAEKYPDARGFGDLSRAERRRVARLLGKSEQELEALQPSDEDESADTEDGAFET